MSRKQPTKNAYDPVEFLALLSTGGIISDSQWKAIAKALWRPRKQIAREKPGANIYDKIARDLWRQQAEKNANWIKASEPFARARTDLAVGLYRSQIDLEGKRASAKERKAGLGRIIKKSEELRGAFSSLDGVSLNDISLLASSWHPETGRSPFNDGGHRGKLSGIQRFGQALLILDLLRQWCATALDGIPSDPTNSRGEAFEGLVANLVSIHATHGNEAALFTQKAGSCSAFIAEVCKQAGIPATPDSINHAIRGARGKQAEKLAD